MSRDFVKAGKEHGPSNDSIVQCNISAVQSYGSRIWDISQSK
jgi:hypothetical protein